MYTEAQKTTLEMISKIGIIPVIAIDDAAKAVPYKSISERRRIHCNQSKEGCICASCCA